MGLGLVEDTTLAAYDIMVYSTPDEGASRRAFRTNITAATFAIGEPVTIATNEITDSEGTAGGVDPVNITGIAAEPAVSTSNRMQALEIEDTLRLVELPDPNKVFRARYFATDGAGTAATPTFAAVAGVLGNLVHNAGTDVWSFDTGAGNANCVGIDVLDANGASLGDDLQISGTGDTVLFRFL